MAVGGVAGWLAGYTTMKLGKMAATAIGGTLLILQIAHHKGYIKVGVLYPQFNMHTRIYILIYIKIKYVCMYLCLPSKFFKTAGRVWSEIFRKAGRSSYEALKIVDIKKINDIVNKYRPM